MNSLDVNCESSVWNLLVLPLCHVEFAMAPRFLESLRILVLIM
jgi:hypothetical protein